MWHSSGRSSGWNALQIDRFVLIYVDHVVVGFVTSSFLLVLTGELKIDEETAMD